MFLSVSRHFWVLGMIGTLSIVSVGRAQSSSLLVTKSPEDQANDAEQSRDDIYFDPAAEMHPYSVFSTAPPKPRTYQEHDLVEIIIRESSNVRSSQEISTEKEYELEGEISNFPQFTLNDIVDAVLKSSDLRNPPKIGVNAERSFEGDGEVKRSDTFTARLKAEVIEVLPNGNLVIEARTQITMDEEKTTLLVSGVCDPKDMTPTGTVLSSQLFDLQIIKTNEGELRKVTKKGLIPRVLDAVFSF